MKVATFVPLAAVVAAVVEGLVAQAAVLAGMVTRQSFSVATHDVLDPPAKQYSWVWASSNFWNSERKDVFTKEQSWFV